MKEQRLLIKVVCFFWLLTKVITYKLWLAERQLPTVALFHSLDGLPGYLHTVSYAVSVLLLLLIVIRPLPFIALLFAANEIFSVGTDILRLQPWEYFYLFVLTFHFIYRAAPVFFYRCLLFIMASTYIFSGIHKFSGSFLYTVWDRFLLHQVFGLKVNEIPLALHYSGLAVAVAECAAGVLLLVLKNKKPAIVMLAAMHVLILFVFGILLKGYNYSVLPWNASMIAILLYMGKFSARKPDYNTFIPLPAKAVLVVFWALLPASNLFGYWAHYLSSGLYSGKMAKVYISYATDAETAGLERFSRRNKSEICEGENIISLTNWSIKETGVLPFPERWYYKRVYENVKAKYKSNRFCMYYTFYPYREREEFR